MAQTSVVLKPTGLYTFPDHLSAVPSGGLLKANNIIIQRDSVAESRRGFKIYGGAMGVGSSTSAHQLLNYKSRLIRHYGAGAGSILEYDTDGTFAPFTLALSGDTHSNTTIDGILSTAQLEVGMLVTGTLIPANTTIASIDSNVALTLSAAAGNTVTQTLTFSWNIAEVLTGRRLRSVESNGNFYFTSSQGMRKICLAASTWPSSPVISLAGGIKALDVALSINAAVGFLTTLTVVAYRIVWGIKDANNNLILGSPSAQTIIRNTSAVDSKTVNLVITIPRGVTTSHFYQIYRTAVAADPAGNQDPGDEAQLVVEDNPTIADLTTGTVTVQDITTESFRAGGANLYTNQNSGEGILQANDLPPLCRDAALFKGYTFYANTSTKQRLNLALLSVVDLKGYTTGAITNISVANPTQVTCAAHGLTTGRVITISGSDSTPTINGSHTVTVLNANTFTVPVNVTIIGTTGTWVTTDQSTITITDGTTSTIYAAAAVEDAANKRFLLSAAATPSQQIDATARSLIHVINLQSTDIVYGYYLSAATDVPGLILLEARKLSQIAFHVVASTTAAGNEFNPALPTSGSTVISTNEVSPNRIYYSKVQQPEAVPLLNYLDVGPQDRAIVRILALRDNLFVLKEDGIYRLSGLVAPFQVYPFDFSTQIAAADSAVVLNNLIYMYSSQGIATISDTGVSVISRPIEDSINKLVIPAYTNFATSTFGISYESDRSYYLFTVSATTDTFATQCFRFNTFTSSWTRLALSKRCGIVNFNDDKLYLGATDTNYLEQERKAFDRTDYSDREIAVTLGSMAIASTNIILPSLTNISVGDVIVQTQYLTIKQFNQLLSKLDNDRLLSPHTYVSVNTALAGDNLSDDLDTLIVKIRDDAGRVAVAGATAGASYTALIGAGAASFSALQTNFNALITLLNADAGLIYANYIPSSSTVDYEIDILSLNSVQSSVGVAFQYPFIVGPLTVYNHISVELQFVPQYFQDVSMTKHVSEGTLIFEDASFSSTTLSYASDLSGNFESQDIAGGGNGIFGGGAFGDGIFGGNGSGVPFRTLLPKEKQRCRYINVKFQHAIGREIFSLYGLSLTYNPISQRGWR